MITQVPHRAAPASRRYRWTMPTAVLLAVLCVVVTFLAAPALTQSSSSSSGVIYDGNNYYFPIFTSSGGNVADGPSGVGSYGVVGYGGAHLNGTVIFSDMGGAGSAIRIINRSGYLSTITGSLLAKGYVDGNATNARFSGISFGNDRANSLVFGNGGYYVADTLNNAIRFTNATTTVTTTNISSSMLSNPNSLAISTTANGPTSVFISNTGANQVLYIPSLSSPLTQVTFSNTSSFQPGAIAVIPGLSRAFIVNRTAEIYCWFYDQANPSSWQVSSVNVSSFGRALRPSSDGTQLHYVTQNGTTIASLSANLSAAASAALVPQKVIDLNSTILGGPVRLFFERSPTSWFVLTPTRYAIVSTVPFDPNSGSGSGGGSGSGSSSGGGSGSGSGSHDLSGRFQDVAAFPSDAFPTNNSCLMSQVYYWLRRDAAAAYSTTDYINQFLVPPTNTTIAYVRGSANVSTWCGNITADHSNDGTLQILDFWSPRSEPNKWTTQNLLANNAYPATHAFLQSLRDEGWKLGALCFVNCTSSCKTATAPQCPITSTCDGVCRGAVAAGAVMGATGVILVILMVISPVNILTAILMVPVI